MWDSSECVIVNCHCAEQQMKFEESGSSFTPEDTQWYASRGLRSVSCMGPVRVSGCICEASVQRQLGRHVRHYTGLSGL